MLVTGLNGRKFFDTNSKLNLVVCQKFKLQGYDGAIRYIGWGKYANDPGDLTKDEMNAILYSGLGLMVVQHVRSSPWVPTQVMGKQDGQTAISELSTIGVPNNICVWLDLEGVKSGTPKQDIIAFCNAWYNEIASKGYVPGIYIGFNSFLSSSDLYNSLSFQHYWRSLSNVPDVAERGYQMEQSAVVGYVNGITIDLDKILIDKKGDSVIYAVADAQCKEGDDMKTIVTYLNDADVFSAVLVAQKNQCPLIKKADFDTSQLTADKVIQIGGKPGSDRFSTFKDAANLL